MQFLDVTTSLDLVDGKLLVGHHQSIDSHYLDDLAETRLASTVTREGMFMKVASIPAAIVDSWAAQGFNILDQRVGAADILRRLRAEDMGRLIATAKRV
ncbi:MAG: hypothetical protein J0H82_06670 [Alphaproteobacteria bacterium]|jgi:hypothetical protein|nr:hypothetical protein [Alphaproteobacteria bacterium]